MNNSSPKQKQPDLSDFELSQIKGMAARGDKQMQIGIWFNINQGRVCEIVKGYKPRYRAIVPAPEHLLPPRGPYRVVPEAQWETALARSRLLDIVETEISETLKRLRLRNERIEIEVQTVHPERSGRVVSGQGQSEEG